MNRSIEIIEILADVVNKIANDCTIIVSRSQGEAVQVACPPINYVFGNAQYIKDSLDELSTVPSGNEIKFPLIALFCPFNEQRNSPEYYTKAKVKVLIACSSSKDWSNGERLKVSFQNILRPIYRRLLEELREDRRLDFGYDGHISHEYSENYSYGRYGAFTDTGEMVSEPIDAINITNLLLTVKQPNCREL